jgi:diphosphomevalonate decarboxylase
LIKYWGKVAGRFNVPATGSLAITLRGLHTETRVTTAADGDDTVTLNGKAVPAERYAPFFERVRERLRTEVRFRAVSANSFPTAAGLASSSSGFAALACACVRAAGADLPDEDLSDLARAGSVSAARAVFGGFVLLPAGATRAVPLHDPSYWPELRVVVVTVRPEEKEMSSREAMRHVRETSPYFPAWVQDAEAVLSRAVAALEKKDLEQLGEAVRVSYLRMFATMFSADPPLFYWLPGSVDLIRECHCLRREGVAAWETMDAGPQVKVLTTERDVDAVVRSFDGLGRGWSLLVSRVGEGPSFLRDG